MSTTDESSQDQNFLNLFMVVIGALICVTIFLIFVARTIAENTQLKWVEEDPAYAEAVDERIKPAGWVALPGNEPEGAAPAAVVAEAATPVPAKLTGEQVYNTACFACHGAGVGGAPKLGDASAWAPRKAKGVATLNQHAHPGLSGPGWRDAAQGRARRPVRRGNHRCGGVHFRLLIYAARRAFARGSRPPACAVPYITLTVFPSRNIAAPEKVKHSIAPVAALLRRFAPRKRNVMNCHDDIITARYGAATCYGRSTPVGRLLPALVLTLSAQVAEGSTWTFASGGTYATTSGTSYGNRHHLLPGH